MKTVPKNYICNNCGKEQYTNSKCYECGSNDFTQIKQETLYPIGIMPKNIWLEKRKQDVKQAIIRYLEADLIPPDEWYEELEDLVRRT